MQGTERPFLQQERKAKSTATAHESGKKDGKKGLLKAFFPVAILRHAGRGTPVGAAGDAARSSRSSGCPSLGLFRLGCVLSSPLLQLCSTLKRRCENRQHTATRVPHRAYVPHRSKPQTQNGARCQTGTKHDARVRKPAASTPCTGYLTGVLRSCTAVLYDRTIIDIGYTELYKVQFNCYSIRFTSSNFD